MEKVKKFIKNKNLINAGEHVIVGLSGGADSVYLLRILNSIKEEMNLKITAVHINHMIRKVCRRFMWTTFYSMHFISD